jgi:hypothetical protein
MDTFDDNESDRFLGLRKRAEQIVNERVFSRIVPAKHACLPPYLLGLVHGRVDEAIEDAQGS